MLAGLQAHQVNLSLQGLGQSRLSLVGCGDLLWFAEYAFEHSQVLSLPTFLQM